MKKQYETIVLKIRLLREDVIRTSAIDDPYDDDYKDPNIQFKE